jgi:hypothetical protein
MYDDGDTTVPLEAASVKPSAEDVE